MECRYGYRTWFEVIPMIILAQVKVQVSAPYSQSEVLLMELAGVGCPREQNVITASATKIGTSLLIPSYYNADHSRYKC